MSTLVMTETEARAVRPRRAVVGNRAVSIWLYGLVVLVMAMVAIGGATRLTGSGLSITEWKPVTGAIPPLSGEAWIGEFEKYRASSQYRNLNRGMAIEEFKTIYWWEWGHRQLGRFLGLYVFVPLIGLWFAGAVTSALALRLLGIGALGGLQATVGWIMVASGLEPGMTAVAPLKLTLHLTIASLILSLIVWVAAGLGRTPVRDRDTRASRWVPFAFLALVGLQIALGGLVAGSRAGLTYNTWPLMDGMIAPGLDALFVVRPLIENLVDNAALVQFNHRMTAYLVVAFALWQVWWSSRRQPDGAGLGRAVLLAGLALTQMALGIVTLLLAVPLWAGLSHQLLAMVLLVAATFHARMSASVPAAVQRTSG